MLNKFQSFRSTAEINLPFDFSVDPFWNETRVNIFVTWFNSYWIFSRHPRSGYFQKDINLLPMMCSEVFHQKVVKHVEKKRENHKNSCYIASDKVFVIKIHWSYKSFNAASKARAIYRRASNLLSSTGIWLHIQNFSRFNLNFTLRETFDISSRKLNSEKSLTNLRLSSYFSSV